VPVILHRGLSGSYRGDLTEIALGDCRKMAYQIAPDYRSSSRRDNRRIVEPCNCCRNAEDGRKGKQDGMSFDRNRLNAVPAPRGDPASCLVMRRYSVFLSFDGTPDSVAAWAAPELSLPCSKGGRRLGPARKCISLGIYNQLILVWKFCLGDSWHGVRLRILWRHIVYWFPGQ